MTKSLPLTPLQTAMYLESTGSDRPWLYLEQIVCHLSDEVLNIDAMKAAWNGVLRDHPALRLVVDTAGTDAPVQYVHDVQEIEIEVLDWSALSAPQAEAALEAFLAEDRARGVDAGVFPAFRLVAIQQGPKCAKLVWSFPHSLLDGRSFARVLDSAFARYDALRSGTLIDDIPALPDRFFQHTQTLSEMSHDAGVDHFADVLRDWEGGTGLADHTCPSTRKHFADHNLSVKQSTGLRDLAAAACVAPSTVILAAWGIVTARFAGRNDTVFGTTLNGRHLVTDTATAPGCFITTVAMRMRFEPGLNLGDVMRRLRDDQIALRPHEQTPLTDMRRKTDVPVGQPLFDTVVMYETGSLDQQMRDRHPRWAKRRVDLHEEGDMAVTMAAYHDEALLIRMEYDPAQVPQGAELAAYFARFLAVLSTATPETPLATLSMLDAKQTARLTKLSGADVTAPSICCVTRFENAARDQGQATALSQSGKHALSYTELDCNANQLAHKLIDSGVQKGDIIALYAARSPMFVTAMLAAWKAGAAFVPMDPTYPLETLAMIASDSTAKLMLATDTAPDLGLPTLTLAPHMAQNYPTIAPDRSAMDPDRLAYVIFTSGSTGRPKGVMVQHSALGAHANAVIETYGLTPQDRALQFAALSVDVALEEIVPTLLCGGHLVLRSLEMVESTSLFLEETAALELTVLNIPTGFWVALTEMLDSTSETLPPSVRIVIVGGERVPLSVLRRWRALVPDVRWINGYGPTETTITCTSFEAPAETPALYSVPIGSPLAHARAWVLAADGSVAPEGTKGELWITGPAVARGYISAPELTAEHFVVAPFDASLDRAYATGDRTYWDNGLLHYIGRTDRQIKLRGFRIEPGQIEEQLEAQTDIGRAYVALHESHGSTPRLVGWVSPANNTDILDLDNVAMRIAEVLPPHMRAALVQVDHWPETPGGKIATRSLPDPVPAVTDPTKADDTTPLTQEVADLFAALLKVEDVAPGASFFDLGGHSLLLLRLLSKLEQRLGTRLMPGAVYADPTPRGIVRALQEKETDPLVVIPVQSGGTEAPIYAVHVLGDNCSFFRPLSAVLGSDQPLYGLTVGLLSQNTPTNIVDIAKFYLHQIERHHPSGPLSLISVSMGSYVAFELAQQLNEAGRDVRALILLDAEGPAGRPRIGKVARFGVHLGQIATKGLPYIRKAMLERSADRHHRKALEINRNNLRAGGSNPVQTIDAFIAANALSVEEYQPKPYPHKITIIHAADDRFDSPAGRATGLGWSEVAAGGFDLRDVPGDHLGILDPPNVEKLAVEVKRAVRGGAAEK
ncbi:non-ribosomal peptide synthetase [Sulfitobacter sp. SK012]|uniref:non-ribosomal peptide synthetase n=1 Tax=Sulfitobacter sp. SK012 TaxID=1389005 RepID=UPI000E0C19C8|nr:non-ribosomal peptide synthetase [Sulfitobacter sp. SK012]AXI46956.1 non-ribosomal peptide synthetase [Sulfitobacter sp. SK012]